MGKNDGSGGTFIARVWYIITPIAAYILVSNICQVLLAMLYQKTVSEVTGCHYFLLHIQEISILESQ